MTNLPLKITQTNRNGQVGFEGTVSITGIKPAKIVRKSDSSTNFATRSALITSARNLATSLGYSDVDYAVPVRKAAKKSVKSIKSTVTDSFSTI